MALASLVCYDPLIAAWPTHQFEHRDVMQFVQGEGV